MPRIMIFRRQHRSTWKPPRGAELLNENNPNRSFSFVDPDTLWGSDYRPEPPAIGAQYIDPLTTLFLRNSCSLLVETVESSSVFQQQARPIDARVSASADHQNILPTSSMNPQGRPLAAAGHGQILHANRVGGLPEQSFIHGQEGDGLALATATNNDQPVRYVLCDNCRSNVIRNEPLRHNLTPPDSRGANLQNPPTEFASTQNNLISAAVGNAQPTEYATQAARQDPAGQSNSFGDAIEQQFSMNSPPFQFAFNGGQPTPPYRFGFYAPSPSHMAAMQTNNLTFRNPVAWIEQQEGHNGGTRATQPTIQPARRGKASKSHVRQMCVSFLKRLASHFSWKRYPNG